MTTTKAIIDIQINTGAAAASLRSLHAQVNAFQSALNKGNILQGAAATEYSKSLASLVNSTGYFTAETIKMRTAAGALDDTLRKGQGTFGKYFSSLQKGTATFNAVQALAQARAAALQTQFVATGMAANGYQQSLAVRPIAAFNEASAVTAERLAIQRALFNQATTSMINFGKNVQWAGRQLMVGFTVPLTILGAVAARTFMNLEKSVISFKKVYGDLFTAPGELTASLDAVKQLGMELTEYGLKLSDTVQLAADAAAAGNEAADLINVTREASRLAVLGQMEQQKALEATISLQNAFAISSEDLADSINFMNLVENQTVLTLQDMTDAIPRVAPVIKGLGGDVKDLAVMLAAMKEGGVSAAQGANALKSGLASLINPSDKAVLTLSRFGINLNQIIEANAGDLMGTVKAFGNAINTLDDLGKQRSIEAVFGKYQFARLGALFNNITKDGTQASRVMDMVGMSTEDLAKTANRELSKIAESPATKLNKAIEQLKVSLIPLGESFVKIATPFAEIFTRILQNINNLPDFAKRIGTIATVLVGLVIPAGTMFLGLLMNLTGTLLKFSNVFKVAFQGFAQGGFGGAVRAVGDSFRYLSLQEIEAATAANQITGASEAVEAALLTQAESAGNTMRAIDLLSGAYTTLITRMEEAAALASGLAVPGGAAKIAAKKPIIVNRIHRNSGGPIPYLSKGGKPTVPGVGNTDTVPAMLTPGEFVVNKEATSKNLGLLHAINDGKTQGLNRGGIAGYMAGGPIRNVAMAQELQAMNLLELQQYEQFLSMNAGSNSRELADVRAVLAERTVSTAITSSSGPLALRGRNQGSHVSDSRNLEPAEYSVLPKANRILQSMTEPGGILAGLKLKHEGLDQVMIGIDEAFNQAARPSDVGIPDMNQLSEHVRNRSNAEFYSHLSNIPATVQNELKEEVARLFATGLPGSKDPELKILFDSALENIQAKLASESRLTELQALNSAMSNARRTNETRTILPKPDEIQTFLTQNGYSQIISQERLSVSEARKRARLHYASGATEPFFFRDRSGKSSFIVKDEVDGSVKYLAQTTNSKRTIPNYAIAQLRESDPAIGERFRANSGGLTPNLQRLNPGGSVFDSSTGATRVPGVGNKDTVPAMLTPGEFVVNKNATANNLGLLKAINSKGSGTSFVADGVLHANGGVLVEKNPLSANVGFGDEFIVREDGKPPKYFGTQEEADAYANERRKYLRSPKGRMKSASSRVVSGITDVRANPSAVGGYLKKKASIFEQRRAARMAAAEGTAESEKGRGPKGDRRAGVGRQSAGGVLMMASMIPMMIGDPKTGQTLGMDSNALSMGAMAAGGLLSLPGKMAIQLAAIAAPLAIFGNAIRISRNDLDKATKKAYEFGTSLGGAADRMEQVSQATGYVFSGQKAKGRQFNFTGQEMKDVQSYSSYFESDKGKKYIDEIKNLTREDRYAKIASEISFAVADGMKPKDAKAYGMAIAAYAGDAFLKQRIVRDFKIGKFKDSSTAMVDLIEQRVGRLEESSKNRTYAPVAAGGLGNAAAKNFFGQTGTNATYGDVALGGAIGVGGGLIAGAAIGAAMGSAIPVVGTVILAAVGAIIGGAIAWVGSNSTRNDILKNSEFAAMNIGSSSQTLKEIANAEALLLEQRRTGKIDREEYAKQDARLRDMKNKSSDTLGNAVEVIYQSGADAETVVGQIKDQLVLSGYDGDQAEAIARTVDFDTMAKQLFPNIDPGELTGDQKNMVKKAIAEIFAGLTPENAGAQITKVTESWRRFTAEVANGVLSAADVVNMTLDQQEKRTNAESLGLAFESAAAALSPEDAIVNPKDIGWQDAVDVVDKNYRRRKMKMGKDKNGNPAFDYYIEDPNGVRVSGVGKTESKNELLETLSKSNRFKDSGMEIDSYLKDLQIKFNNGGQSSQDVLNDMGEVIRKRINETGDYRAVLADLEIQLPGISSEFKKMASYDPEKFGKIFNVDPNSDYAMKEVKSNIVLVADAADRGNFAFRGLSTTVSRAGIAMKEWAAENTDRIEGLGISIEDLGMAAQKITEKGTLDLITEGTDGDRMKFAWLVSNLQDAKYAAIELTNATNYIFKNSISATNFRNELDKIAKSMKNIDFEKFGKNAQTIKNMAPDPMTFINYSLAIGKSLKDVPAFYEEALKDIDLIQDKFKKNITKKGKVKVTTDLVIALGGKTVDAQAGAITAALNKIFPNKLDPLTLPLILSVPNVGGILSNIAGGYGTGEDGKRARVPEGAVEAFNAGEETFTVNYQGGVQTLKTADYAAQIQYNQILDLINPRYPAGEEDPKKEDGGDKQKSLFQQLKEQMLLARKMFDAIHDLMYNETQKGVMFDADFKKFIAGPFAPEFLEYLRSQGAEGLKIINGGISKVKEAYKNYVLAKGADLASQALYLPMTLRAQKNVVKREVIARRNLGAAGKSGEEIDFIMEKTKAMREQARANKDLIKQELAKPKGQQDLVAIEKAKEYNRTYKNRIQWVKEHSAELVKQNQLLSQQNAIQALSDDLEKSKMAMAYVARGETLEMATQLAEISNGQLLTNAQVAEAKEKILSIKALSVDPIQLRLDIIDVQDQISSQKAEIKIAQEVQKKFATEVAAIGLKSAEQLLEELNLQNDAFSRRIELENRRLEPIDEAIAKLNEEKEIMNKMMDERLKALDQVEKANERIFELQKNQLGIAQSLSTGDVAGAARASMELQQTMARQNGEATRNSLEESKKNANLAFEDSINAKKEERKKIEDNIKQIQLDQRAVQDRIYTMEKSIKDITVSVNREYSIGIANIDAMKFRLEQLIEKERELLGVLEKQKSLRSQLGLPEVSTAGITTPEKPLTPYTPPPWISTNPEDYKNLSSIDWSAFAGIGDLFKLGPILNTGGTVRKYASGSFVNGDGGRDSVPAMLTPGEFVMRRAAVDKFGPMLAALNMGAMPTYNIPSSTPYGIKGETSGNSAVYNYDVNVNVAGTNASPEDIANVVISKIKMTEDRKMRSYRF